MTTRSPAAEVVTTPGRAEALSDGVFAIAITLLVLDLHVPPGHSGLLRALVAQWPQYAAYAVSFLTIGIVDARVSLAVMAALAVYYAVLPVPGHARGHR